MSVAKRLIEGQLEENARQENDDREYVVGAFYWVRHKGRREIVRYDPARAARWESGSRQTAWFKTGIEPPFTTADFDEIGPCLGKEPPPSMEEICRKLGYDPEELLRPLRLRPPEPPPEPRS